MQVYVQGTLAEKLNEKVLAVTGKLGDFVDYINIGNSNSAVINWQAQSRVLVMRNGLPFVEIRSNSNVVRTKLVN